MVQNPKGGGLSSSFGGSAQMGGVQKTTDFLDKSTWFLAGLLIVFILLSSISFTGTLSDTNSKIIDETEAAAPKTATPAAIKATEAVKTEGTTPAKPAEETKK